MLKSLTEYSTALGKWGFVVLVELIGSAIGVWFEFNPSVDPAISNIERIRGWVWFSALIAGLVIPPFIAFHIVRKQRDAAISDAKEARSERALVRPHLWKWHLFRGQVGGGSKRFDLRTDKRPLAQNERYLVDVDISINSDVDAILEEIKFNIGSESLSQCISWSPTRILGESMPNAMFLLPKGFRPGRYKATVTLYVDREKYESPPKEVEIPTLNS